MRCLQVLVLAFSWATATVVKTHGRRKKITQHRTPRQVPHKKAAPIHKHDAHQDPRCIRQHSTVDQSSSTRIVHPTNASEILDESGSLFTELQAVLDATWTNHTVVSSSRATVESAWAGRFRCSPTVWLLIAGQYRTFDSTARGFLEAGSRTSTCFGVAIFTEIFIDQPDELKQKWAKSMWRTVSRDRAAVPALLQQHANTTFGATGQFTYAAVRRTGAIEDYPTCLPFWWHGVWALARWALVSAGLQPLGNALVIRTRPDVALTDWFEPSRLLALFSQRSHVVHGQESRGQGDILLICDLRTYERDIALPIMASARLDATSRPIFKALAISKSPSISLARELWDRANGNGWGWGRSILNGVQPFHAPCMNACLCLDGSTRCEPTHVVCYVDVLVSDAYHTMHILRQPQHLPATRADKPPVVLGTKLLALCAFCASLHIDRAKFVLRPKTPWMKDNNFLYARRATDIPTDRGRLPGALASLWPAGCGAGLDHLRSLVPADQCSPAYYFYSTHIDEIRARHVSVDKPLQATIRHSPDFIRGGAYVSINPNYVWRDNMT